MKTISFSILCLLFLLVGCGGSGPTISEGHIVYSVDYPTQRSNFFLYGILPKEMTVYFKNNQTLSIIQKANLENRIFVDCDKHSFETQFIYGGLSTYANLNRREIQQLREKQPKYSLNFTDNSKIIAGCEAFEVIATSITNPTDKIELWYTNAIGIEEPNWYNPFSDIDGVLLQYAIDRYGIRMVFTAKEVNNTPITRAQFRWKPIGDRISYKSYNHRIAQLFQTFE